MSAHADNTSLRYCGRDFSPQEIDWIRRLIASEPKRNRMQLSRGVCEELDWVRPNGHLKDMSCRVAMLRMERDGLIQLPPPQHRYGSGHTRPRLTCASDPRFPVSVPAGELDELVFEPVVRRKDSSLWNELIERYHYLGYKPLPGAQLRYLVFSGPHLLAAIGFGAAAWKVGPRDRFIGWPVESREKKNSISLSTTPASLYFLGSHHTTLLPKSSAALPSAYRKIGKHAMVTNPSC